MGREIKFRVWDSTCQKMYQGACELNGSVYWNDGKGESGFNSIYRDGRYVLEQYTGLKDIEGVEIYEGDIVCAMVKDKESISDNPFEGYNKKKAYWSIEHTNHYHHLGFTCYGSNRRFNTPLSKSIMNACELKVAGNIHQNPELLESKK